MSPHEPHLLSELPPRLLLYCRNSDQFRYTCPCHVLRSPLFAVAVYALAAVFACSARRRDGHHRHRFQQHRRPIWWMFSEPSFEPRWSAAQLFLEHPDKWTEFLLTSIVQVGSGCPHD